MRKTAARVDLETPHRREFIASNEARMKEGRMPDTLRARLRWYERAWWEETPDHPGHPGSMHVSGLWRSDGKGNRGIPPVGEVEGAVYRGPPLERLRIAGGSKLGTPQMSDPFRRYIEDSPLDVDPDGYYRRPLAAALHKMAHPDGRKSGRPLIARWLFRVARAGFDWHRAADGAGKPHEEAELLTDKGLEILWRLYGEYPSRREQAA